MKGKYNFELYAWTTYTYYLIWCNIPPLFTSHSNHPEKNNEAQSKESNHFQLLCCRRQIELHEQEDISHQQRKSLYGTSHVPPLLQKSYQFHLLLSSVAIFLVLLRLASCIAFPLLFTHLLKVSVFMVQICSHTFSLLLFDCLFLHFHLISPSSLLSASSSYRNVLSLQFTLSPC